MLWSEALTMCAFLLRFPVLAGLYPAGWGSRATWLQRYGVPALLLAGVALQFICIQIACREARLFRTAKWITGLKLLFTAVWCALSCGWPSVENDAADILYTCATLCQLFIYYDILTGTLYIAYSLADYPAMSLIEATRNILFATCGAITLTHVMRLLIQDPRAVLALGIANLLVMVASSAVFMYTLYRVLRLETERQSGNGKG